MKAQKFKFNQILKLYLLKSKVYEQVIKKNNLDFSVELNLTQIIVNLKKALQIIFRYDQAHKKILFVGLPKHLELKINKFTDHVAVPESFNLQGFIFSGFSKGKLQENSFQIFLPKLSTRPDLVVVLSHKKKESLLTESYLAKIPFIEIGDQTFSNSWSYNVPGHTQSLLNSYNQNLFFISLNFLFNKNVFYN